MVERILIVILRLIKMEMTKEKYSQFQKQTALYAKAFAHPARVAILQHLFKIGACVCGDIVDEIGLAQSTISQHLKELKSIGLIKGTIEGTSVCYCIDTENWNKMKSEMKEFLNHDAPQTDCCL